MKMGTIALPSRYEHIDRANRIALVDPIRKAFWQQRRLPAIQSRHKACHQIPRRFSRGSWHEKGFHTACARSGLSRQVSF
jgi:hypothetical protein